MIGGAGLTYLTPIQSGTSSAGAKPEKNLDFETRASRLRASDALTVSADAVSQDFGRTGVFLDEPISICGRFPSPL